MTIKVNTTIYVGHLSFNTKEAELRKLFSRFGKIVTIDIPTESNSERELGYAKIEFAEKESAEKAIEKINGKEFNGRLLKVNAATTTRCRGRW